MRAETLSEVASAVGGRAVGRVEGRPTGFSIDSRSAGPGDLFFAIVGPNRDGHEFVATALERGAFAAVVSDATALPEGASGVIVADTTKALQDLAISRRKKLDPKVIGITGSAGKTTAKEMTREALSGTFEVLASRGNLNNLYGLPLSLLRLEEKHQIAVLEMGISTDKEMPRLTEIADPDVGVLTNVYGAHLAFFSGLDAYARAKAELFRNMRPNTTGVFNHDDERSRVIAQSFHGYAVTFGMASGADFQATGFVPLGLDGSTFSVEHAGRSVQVRLRIAGAHHALNALAALAAGYMLGGDLEEMAGRLGGLEPLEMRGRVLKLEGNIRVLDDSYNANPAAMRSAIAVLAQTPAAGGRRVAVLGDMLELGEEAPARHKELGRFAAASGIQVIFAVGPLSRETAGGAREAGIEDVRIFESAAEAEQALLSEVRPGDLVLVKASRGIGLDKLVRALGIRFGGRKDGGGDA